MSGNNSCCNAGNDDIAETAKSVVIFGIGVTLGSVIIITNTTVIVTLARYKRLMISLRFLILNMAIADGIIGALFIYDAAMANIIRASVRLECLLRSVIITTVMLASMMTISLMAMDRALPIYFPFRYSACITGTKVSITIIFMWMFAFLFGAVPYFVFSVKGFKECQSFVFPHNLPLTIHVSAWYILLVLQFFCNVLIYYAAKKHIRRIVPTHVWDSKIARNKIRFRMHLKATGTVVTVLVCFVVCWTPVMGYFTYRLVHQEIDYTHDNQVLALNGLLLVALINSLLNPIIYGYKFRSVRRAFSVVFCCTKNNKIGSSQDQIEYIGRKNDFLNSY